MWSAMTAKMKMIFMELFILCFGVVSIIAATTTPATTTPATTNVVLINHGSQSSLLGSALCTRGPSFWCQNITNAKSCRAVKHCIQSVWEHQELPPDNDDVCKICKDMVAQARAQLQSNETQDELRQVFEGSCRLIPIRVVAKDCIKLVDEFIPELVETLASQMNPQMVCSVAGLCNSVRIDNLLTYGEDFDREDLMTDDLLEDYCNGCNIIAKQMEWKFRSASRDHILNNMLEACGRLGSLSDGCSAVAITHFNAMYNHLVKNLESEGLCGLAGVCQYKFHSHAKKNIEVIHESSVGILKPEKDDLPCELCEQLVIHFRDILVANTTENEFEEVLQGICKQFTEFKDQCLGIVNEYYGVIYEYLVNNLKPKDVCTMIDICPRPGSVKGPIWPLLPPQIADNFQANRLASEHQSTDIFTSRIHSPVIGLDEANSYPTLHRVPIRGKGVGVRVSQREQQVGLPAERMLPQTITYVANKEVCTLCEYLLHYIQVALTTPSTESEIKNVVGKACDHLPDSINAQCRAFVNTYGDALVALLAQEIDPSQVCPELGLCPRAKVMLDLTHLVNDKPTCPLCLFAVEELDTKLKNNRTEEDIKRALDNLCSDLPKSLAPQCRNFVESYSEELVDMLIADFTPQEVCAYLRLCDEPSKMTVNEVLTNEIYQLPMERLMPQTIINLELAKHQKNVKDTTSCVICEFVMTKIDSALKDSATEAEIKVVVHDVCNYMPKTVGKECNAFVDQYADLVITLLSQSLDPKEVCTEISLCRKKTRLESAASLEECAVCDAALEAMDQLLADPTIEKDVSHALQGACIILPAHNIEQCKSMVRIYGPSILNLIAKHTETNIICEKIGMCPRNRQIVNLLGGKKCSWGPGYWCQSKEHANSCGALAHCQERVWMADNPKITH